ncbi:uncharacterized protein [Diadema antillarum]|uniref:uncharacterized protein n=2 Tax=Diadema antillarum TaxID=105358 RepID=UPI003A8786BD
MPDRPEDSSNSCWRSGPLTGTPAGGRGQGQETKGSLTSTPAQESLRCHPASSASEKRTSPRERPAKKSKRPDQQLYVPRGRRQTGNTSKAAASPKEQDSSPKGTSAKKVCKEKHSVPDAGSSIDECNEHLPSEIGDSQTQGRTDERHSPGDRRLASSYHRNRLSCDANTDVDISHANERLSPGLDSSQHSEASTVAHIPPQGTHLLADTGKSDCLDREELPHKPQLSADDIFQKNVNSAPHYVEANAQENPVNQNTASLIATNTSDLTSSAIKSCEAESPAEFANPRKDTVGQQDSERCISQSEFGSWTESGAGVSVVPGNMAETNPAAGATSKVDSASRDDSAAGEPARDKDEHRKDGMMDDGKGGRVEAEKEEEEDSWDAMFDDEGNSLKEDEIKEITEGVGGVAVSVKKAANDYYNFSPKDTLEYSKLEHVIEVYDFPNDFKTADLMMAFNAFKNKGFDIKWVDDTHALVVFATAQIAEDALSLQNPMMRTRPLSLATKQSKQKAKGVAEFLQPYKPRPETSSVAARRMVSSALGIKSTVSKEQRAAEKQKLKEAKEKKREEKRQQADMWEGNI